MYNNNDKLGFIAYLIAKVFGKERQGCAIATVFFIALLVALSMLGSTENRSFGVLILAFLGFWGFLA